MKAAAAAGVGAVVWAEPTIKGLAKRPAYASAGSTDITEEITITGDVTTNAAGVSTISDLMWSPLMVGGQSFTLTAVNQPNGRVRIALGGDGGVLRYVDDGTISESGSVLDTADPINDALRRVRFERDASETDFSITVKVLCPAVGP
jgi:hypothetical protein